MKSEFFWITSKTLWFLFGGIFFHLFLWGLAQGQTCFENREKAPSFLTKDFIENSLYLDSALSWKDYFSLFSHPAKHNEKTKVRTSLKNFSSSETIRITPFNFYSSLPVIFEQLEIIHSFLQSETPIDSTAKKTIEKYLLRAEGKLARFYINQVVWGDLKNLEENCTDWEELASRGSNQKAIQTQYVRMKISQLLNQLSSLEETTP